LSAGALTRSNARERPRQTIPPPPAHHLLYEADYNLYLKLMWAKRLVRHAEDHNKLGEEQGGSRPGRTAIDIANRKALTYLYRLTKTCLGTFLI
jgi:hypothetical protein